MSPRAALGDLEQAVMDHLWSAQEAGGPDWSGVSVREVHDVLGAQRDLAYTTLMTVLDRLAKKGLAERERDGRAWRYRAAASRDRLTAEALRTTLDPLAGEDRRAALLHFLDRSTPEELDDLRAALAELEQRRADRA